MSKYTTELRYICETEAGLKESKGYDDIANIIANSRTKIFSFDYPIYDEAYRSVLETKILKHYYTREIGLETYGLWKLKLDTKMNEIMPFYNQLYKSQLLEFNPLYTHNLYREGNKDTSGDSSGTENTTASRDTSSTDSIATTLNKDAENTLRKTGTETLEKYGTENVDRGISEEIDSTVTTNEVSRDKYSDTPQGSLQNIENDTYLTNARKITDDTTQVTDSNRELNEDVDTTTSETNTKTFNTTDTNTIDETDTETVYKTSAANDGLEEKKDSTNEFTNTEQYLEHIYGYMNRDASELLLKYRKTFLNIDLQIIDELEELFLHLW